VECWGVTWSSVGDWCWEWRWEVALGSGVVEWLGCGVGEWCCGVFGE
jgi:hypothetical protein